MIGSQNITRAWHSLITDCFSLSIKNIAIPFYKRGRIMEILNHPFSIIDLLFLSLETNYNLFFTWDTVSLKDQKMLVLPVILYWWKQDQTKLNETSFLFIMQYTHSTRYPESNPVKLFISHYEDSQPTREKLNCWFSATFLFNSNSLAQVLFQ